jgi:hypothetical protein
MKSHRTTRVALTALTTVALVAPAALGAGEPKNESPFTRPVAGVTSAVHGIRLVAGAPLAIAGEPKNEVPFTRPSNDDPGLARTLREVSGGTLAPAGERKSEPPFSTPARSEPTVTVVGGGFSWTDAAIGMLVTAGLGLAGAGVYLLARTVRPASTPGAVGRHS